MADKGLLRRESLGTSRVVRTLDILQTLEELDIQPFYEGRYKRMTVYESSRSCIIRNRWWILGLVFFFGCFAPLLAILTFIHMSEDLRWMVATIFTTVFIASVFLFLMFAEDDPLGEWKRISLDEYQGSIPRSVLEIVTSIKNRLLNVEFHIEYFSSGSQRKCFLIFSCGSEKHHIDFWEESEPEFEATTANCLA